MTPFERVHGGIAVHLDRAETILLTNLAHQLVGMLQERAKESVPSDAPDDVLFARFGIGGPDEAPRDPALARLLPDAYRCDRDAASQHRHLTERGLVDRKVQNARAVAASLESAASHESISLESPEPVLDDAGVQSWLRCLTDLRLTIAVRLGIESDDETDDIETDETRGGAMHDVYDWLGYLQGSLVELVE